MSGLRHAGLCLTATLLLCGGVRAEVLVNEIMYNSPGSPDVEYVELYNPGPTALDLSGWYLLDDDDAHDRCFLAGVLDPGEYLVVAGLLAEFNATYPGVGNVNPNPFDDPLSGVGFGLGNDGDTVRLFDLNDVLVDVVAYGDADPWPFEPDGGGPSLELVSPTLDNSLPDNWGVSTAGPPGGTPGSTNSVFDEDLPPSIGAPGRSPPLPAATDTVALTAAFFDTEGLAQVELRIDRGTGFEPEPMFDDGLHGDGDAGDSVYGAEVAPLPHGTVVRYFFYAEDSAAQYSVYPAGAPVEYLAYTVGYRPPPLQISEFLASNQSGIVDERGQREDWVEIRNRGPEWVNLSGMFLTDDLDEPRMWRFPTAWIEPGGRRLVWCDEDPEDGPLHATFRLSRSGGEVGLYDTVDHGNLLLHGLTFGPQSADNSFGFLPDDADAPEYIATPTPRNPNAGSVPLSPVCINEFLARSQVGGIPDWIELFNRSAVNFDLGGWWLSDDARNPQKYLFAAGTVLPPGGFLSLEQDELGFALAGDGEEVILLTYSDGQSGMDYLDYGPQSPDVSQGRLPDGAANWHFFSSWTRDYANACPVISPLPTVNGLRADTGIALGWEPLQGAEVYDVVRGDLDLLRAAEGDFSLAGVDCLENNSSDTVSLDLDLPLPGAGRFYLVRGSTLACRFGTYDSGGPAQSAPRDDGLSTAPDTCP